MFQQNSPSHSLHDPGVDNFHNHITPNIPNLNPLEFSIWSIVEGETNKYANKGFIEACFLGENGQYE